MEGPKGSQWVEPALLRLLGFLRLLDAVPLGAGTFISEIEEEGEEKGAEPFSCIAIAKNLLFPISDIWYLITL